MHANSLFKLSKMPLPNSATLYAFHNEPKKFLAFCAPCPFAQTKRADFVKFDERRTWKTGGKHDMIAAVDHDAALCV